jgi:hypothetical protein
MVNVKLSIYVPNEFNQDFLDNVKNFNNYNDNFRIHLKNQVEKMTSCFKYLEANKLENSSINGHCKKIETILNQIYSTLASRIKSLNYSLLDNCREISALNSIHVGKPKGYDRFGTDRRKIEFEELLESRKGEFNENESSAPISLILQNARKNIGQLAQLKESLSSKTKEFYEITNNEKLNNANVKNWLYHNNKIVGEYIKKHANFSYNYLFLNLELILLDSLEVTNKIKQRVIELSELINKLNDENAAKNKFQIPIDSKTTHLLNTYNYEINQLNDLSDESARRVEQIRGELNAFKNTYGCQEDSAHIEEIDDGENRLAFLRNALDGLEKKIIQSKNLDKVHKLQQEIVKYKELERINIFTDSRKINKEGVNQRKFLFDESTTNHKSIIKKYNEINMLFENRILFLNERIQVKWNHKVELENFAYELNEIFEKISVMGQKKIEKSLFNSLYDYIPKIQLSDKKTDWINTKLNAWEAEVDISEVPEEENNNSNIEITELKTLEAKVDSKIPAEENNNNSNIEITELKTIEAKANSSEIPIEKNNDISNVEITELKTLEAKVDSSEIPAEENNNNSNIETTELKTLEPKVDSSQILEEENNDISSIETTEAKALETEAEITVVNNNDLDIEIKKKQ